MLMVSVIAGKTGSLGKNGIFRIRACVQSPKRLNFIFPSFFITLPNPL